MIILNELRINEMGEYTKEQKETYIKSAEELTKDLCELVNGYTKLNPDVSHKDLMIIVQNATMGFFVTVLRSMIDFVDKSQINSWEEAVFKKTLDLYNDLKGKN